MSTNPCKRGKRARSHAEPIEDGDAWKCSRCGAKLCGAKDRGERKGNRCKREPMVNGRCVKHGGKSLVGPAAPSFKHGGYSKFLGGALLEGYQALQSDTEILSLRDEIKLWRARHDDLLSRMQSMGGPSVDAWKKAREALVEVETAIEEIPDGARGEARIGAVVEPLEQLRRALFGDYRDELWKELQQATDTIRQLRNVERKLMEAHHQMLSAEQAMHLLAMVTALALRHITEKKEQAVFADEVRRLSAGDTPRVDPDLLPRVG